MSLNTEIFKAWATNEKSSLAVFSLGFLHRPHIIEYLAYVDIHIARKLEKHEMDESFFRHRQFFSIHSY